MFDLFFKQLPGATAAMLWVVANFMAAMDDRKYDSLYSFLVTQYAIYVICWISIISIPILLYGLGLRKEY